MEIKPVKLKHKTIYTPNSIYTGCNRNAGTKLNHAYKN